MEIRKSLICGFYLGNSLVLLLRVKHGSSKGIFGGMVKIDVAFEWTIHPVG
jgi:hypothetical protein